MSNPVFHFEIQSLESEKSQDFFRDVSGWQIDVVPEMGYGLVNTGAGVVMPVTVIPGAVTMALFSDPAGAVVGLVAGETPPAE